MKVCPYCREEIQDEAVKCRYCSSSLVEKEQDGGPSATQPADSRRVVYSIDRRWIGVAKIAAVVVVVLGLSALLLYLDGAGLKQGGAGPDQATYIVDRGLLRFAKFAAALLALFVTVGVFLYGFNLKEVAKEIRDLADGMRDLHQKAMDTNYEIGKAKDAVAADRARSARLLKRIEDSVVMSEAEQQKIAGQVEENRRQLESLLEHGQSSILEMNTTFQSKLDQMNAPALKGAKAKRNAAKSLPYEVPELTRHYDFPTGLDGSGQCIGLIELGGGYKRADLERYFEGLGIKMPAVKWESVDGAKNKTSGPGGVDGQVYSDIEVAGAAAPGARIVVYFAPNTSDGFLHAVQAAVADEVNRPSVLSISWGSPEVRWTEEELTKFNEAFEAAAIGGITVVCAAGDSGVTDGMEDGRAHVDFPGSSPWVLSCGGTNLRREGKKVLAEVVWNEGDSGTGGGVSEMFPQPAWQAGAGVPLGRNGKPGRGVPDVAAHANPYAGYSIFLHGASMVVGGTAAAAPLWAALVALLNQGLGRNLGNFHELLYRELGPAGVLHGITEGDNGIAGVKGFAAGPGWNACAGWGSPRGGKLLEALRSLKEKAGEPTQG